MENQNKPVNSYHVYNAQQNSTVQLENVKLLQKAEVKYLGMYLDGRLTWAEHIKAKLNQLNIKVKTDVLVA